MNLHAITLPYIDSADLFERVAGQEWAIFLDSGVVNQKKSVSKHANYDVLAIRPESTIVFESGISFCWDQQEQVQKKLSGDPIALLQGLIPKIDENSKNSEKYAYVPGALGYFSYDLAREYESLPVLAINDENLPEMAVGIYSVIVLVDHIKKKTFLLSLGESEHTKTLVSFWSELINYCVKLDEVSNGFSVSDCAFSVNEIKENLNFEDYSECFERVRKYTIEGDCYQVNLAKRFSAEINDENLESSWPIYDHLRKLSPAPYGAYMNLPFAQVLSNSPESFIKCIGREVTTSPIKGTKPRDHKDHLRDNAIADSLLNSEKDRAENLMIVDLMRNDLSRCCELGSVKVPKLFAVHSFANVHHLISTVTGILRKGLHSLDLFRSCFPGGSITGAPKIRAMEIIEELEPHRRGLYCGAIGYVGANGDLQTNIAIRTMVIKDGVIRYSAGGGLVIDSQLEEEYQEIIDKAKMMNETLS